jgi:hypothetical protein
MLLHNVNSRGVQDGYTVQTSIDSLLIATRMNSGVAISRYTPVMTPSALDETKVTRGVGGIMDSIEMIMSFQLPSDFVADSMWLWVGGEAVPASIQDRALASQHNIRRS